MALIFALMTELVPGPNNTLTGDCSRYRLPCVVLSEPLNIAQYENQRKLERCLACSVPHGPPYKTKGSGTTAHIPGITVWTAWHCDNSCNPSASAGVSLLQDSLCQKVISGRAMCAPGKMKRDMISHMDYHTVLWRTFRI